MRLSHFGFFAALFLAMPGRSPAADDEFQFDMRGVLLSAAEATPERLDELKSESINTIVLELEAQKNDGVKNAALRIKEHGLELRYWIEVGRNPELADAHPEWMSSFQWHNEYLGVSLLFRELKIDG